MLDKLRVLAIILLVLGFIPIYLLSVGLDGIHARYEAKQKAKA